MLTYLAITGLCVLAAPLALYAGVKLAEWIDGDAGYIIRRRQELVRQGGYTHDQAEEQAHRELCERKYR